MMSWIRDSVLALDDTADVLITRPGAYVVGGYLAASWAMLEIASTPGVHPRANTLLGGAAIAGQLMIVGYQEVALEDDS
jgi:hypothetical protein